MASAPTTSEERKASPLTMFAGGARKVSRRRGMRGWTGPKPQSGRPGAKGGFKTPFKRGNPMRTRTVLGLNAALAALAFTATPAAAHDLGGGFTINGGATVVSDYRFRGI